MKLIKPPKLQQGDTVAAITLSWAGSATFPHRYETAKKQFEETFGCKVIETPNALKKDDFIYNNPKARAEDLMWAFKNPDVKAIISIIGGDDTIRLLPYIDYEVIRNNPKIFMGYSDSTVNHFMCLKAGLMSYYGPCMLAEFAENQGILPYTKNSVSKALFSDEIIGKLPENDGWTVEHIDWSKPENQKIKRKLNTPMPWKWLQGRGKVEGHLIGGCMDVLEFMKETELWNKEDWKNAVLFFEVSEEAPSPNTVKYWLRNYGAQGILKTAKAILFGRPGNDDIWSGKDYEKKNAEHIEKMKEYDDILLQVAKEYGREDLPIITRMDFGHTAPMMVLPYGAKATIDADNQTIVICFK
jgi:muramoyltetrapeptide carboxypeptidase LdcA involved in peptidoglycan recycling